ncbi:MAG: DUF1513 domain-containing protein [Myxococcota bacterium]
MSPALPSWSLSRRRFLASLGTVMAAPAGIGCDASPTAERWVSAQGDSDETYGLVIAEPGGSSTTVRSGFRGHAMAHHPSDGSRVVMFGRRPGQFGIVVDIDRARVVQRFECTPHRRFAGHGCFDADGTRLLTVEADIETGAGIVAVRDAATLEVVREIETHGIGPHEIVLMPDGRTLAVANGGILTRPETGADKLNLDTMRSTLVYLDLDSGQVLDEQGVLEPKASLRHLAVADDGTVVVVMQIQREALEDDEPRPLIAVHHPGQSLEPFTDGLELSTAMQDYAASVAVDDHARIAAVPSPRGNLVGFWHIDTGAWVGQHAFDDVSGVTVSAEHGCFVLSGSGGQVRLIDTETLAEATAARERFSDVRWDNHLLAISPLTALT